MRFDQLDQPLFGLLLRDFSLDASLADIEIDLSRSGADITEVGIGHLPRAVDNAAHNGNFDPGKVSRAASDPLGNLLQVK